MLDSVDIDCAVNILAKQAVEVAQKVGLDTSRQRLHQTTVDILRCSKNPSSALLHTNNQHMSGGLGPGGFPSTLPGQYATQPGGYGGGHGHGGGHAAAANEGPIPVTLQLLPLYSMSLQVCMFVCMWVCVWVCTYVCGYVGILVEWND